VTNPSVLVVTETIGVGLISYFLSLVREIQLATPGEVYEAIRVFNISKATGTNVITKRAFKHLPKLAVSLLALSSTRFGAPITFPKRRSTLELSLSPNRGRIQHCPLPIVQLVSWTRSVFHLKNPTC